MNDLVLEYLLKDLEIGFLDEFGEGKTSEDEIIQNLIFTCEEGTLYEN